MAQYPRCHGDLHPDPRNPGKLLCYNCKKRYDEAAVERYWSEQNGTQQAQQPSTTKHRRS